MLYLNPPFHIINGVSVFSDHADPLQFYFLPLMPKLTQLKDQETGDLIPQIQLIKYRGRAGNGGFLNFDVNLGADQTLIEDVRAEIKRLHQLRDQPHLAPVPLVDGTVKMMLFGKQTGDAPANDTTTANPASTATTPAPNPTAPQFVLKMDHHAKPALYGDNQAAFSVALDQSGVVVLEQALKGEMSPIGIVYSLDYLALRPAYSVRLNVDWDRVQKHLDEKFSGSFLVFSTEIEKVVDELEESRAIVIEADIFVTETDENSGVVGRRDQALNDVRDMITDTFFTPSIDPIRQEVDGWDKFLHVAERTSQIAASGGLSSVASFGYKKSDQTRIDRKNLNVNISERTTVKRSIYPQGHLAGLFRVLRKPGMDVANFIKSVDLDDPWFTRRTLNVISRGNFNDDSISSLNVHLRYKNEPKNVLLESSGDRKTLDWSSQFANNEMLRDVAFSYKVTFKDVDNSERPLSLKSKEQIIDADNLEINPRELYSIVSVPIVALSFPWKRYPTVEVQTRYTDKANNIQIDDSFLLDEKKADVIWKFFVLDSEHTKFSYKTIYRAADHQDVEMPWMETDEERVTLRDPFPQKRSLVIVPSIDWSKVERVFVDVSYTDAPNDVVEEQSFEFSSDDQVSQTFVVDLVNKEHQLVQFQATIMLKDGSIIEVPRSSTLERRKIIRSDMRGHRIVKVHPAATNFGAKKLREMKIEITYEDIANNLSYADVFNFKSATEQAHFEYDYVETDNADYKYKVHYLFTNGMSRATEWEQNDAEELIVPVG